MLLKSYFLEVLLFEKFTILVIIEVNVFICVILGLIPEINDESVCCFLLSVFSGEEGEESTETQRTPAV